MNPTNTKFQQQCKEKTTNSINCSDVMSTFRQISFIFLLAISLTEAFTTVTSQPRAVSKLASADSESLSSSVADVSRRNVFQKSFVAAIALTPTLANALDMDAFANAQVRSKWIHARCWRWKKTWNGNATWSFNNLNAKLTNLRHWPSSSKHVICSR